MIFYWAAAVPPRMAPSINGMTVPFVIIVKSTAHIPAAEPTVTALTKVFEYDCV